MGLYYLSGFLKVLYRCVQKGVSSLKATQQGVIFKMIVLQKYSTKFFLDLANFTWLKSSWNIEFCKSILQQTDTLKLVNYP